MTETRQEPLPAGRRRAPLYLAGRDAPLRRFDAMLRAAPEQQANMRVTGLRGVGKTMLLEAFAERAREHEWEPAFMELQPGHNTDTALATAIGSLLERPASGFRGWRACDPRPGGRCARRASR